MAEVIKEVVEEVVELVIEGPGQGLEAEEMIMEEDQEDLRVTGITIKSAMLYIYIIIVLEKVDVSFPIQRKREETTPSIQIRI